MSIKIFGKSLKLHCEKYGGLITGIIVFILFFFLIRTDSYNYKEIIKEFPSIGMFVFGFLLTLLGIILQANTGTIEMMKRRTVLYKRFIYYNKRTVIIAFILSIYSFVIGNLKININYLHQLYFFEYLKQFTIAIFWGMVAKFIFDTYIFVKIFFILLKK